MWVFPLQLWHLTSARILLVRATHAGTVTVGYLMRSVSFTLLFMSVQSVMLILYICYWRIMSCWCVYSFGWVKVGVGQTNHKYFKHGRSKLDHTKAFILEIFETLKFPSGFGLNDFLCAHPHYDFCLTVCITGSVQKLFREQQLMVGHWQSDDDHEIHSKVKTSSHTQCCLSQHVWCHLEGGVRDGHPGRRRMWTNNARQIVK